MAILDEIGRHYSGNVRSHERLAVMSIVYEMLRGEYGGQSRTPLLPI